jgi:CDP-diacylglycerol---serine O-phosphatidyltransferase
MSDIKLFTVPNLFTAANLVCGLVGIQQAFEGNTVNASICIYMAAMFDFVDGFVARLFKSTSELGKQLDSLCDVVSFGVLPGFILYGLLQEYRWVAFAVPVFSALRLAKFNIDTRQSNGFVGVPTPINALFVTSLAFVFDGKVVLEELNYLLLFLCLFTSVMLVVEMPLLSLKFKGFTIRQNLFRYLLFFVSGIFVLILKQESFIAIYFYYLLLSLLFNKLDKSTHEIPCAN